MKQTFKVCEYMVIEIWHKKFKAWENIYFEILYKKFKIHDIN